MQLNNEFAPVMKSSNQMETGQASIEMTAHMFQILSAGIYQHPERACIRELSINGLDGQQMAGNLHVPLDVHLPTRLEPYFEVRDHGTGMTHEQVMKLYLTYGASTKRDSNDQVGGLGIGSKSPFAVAQSFTVTVFQDGSVRRYSVYMEEGVPQVTKLTESATTEPNGVAVRVAVPMEKIDKFLREANAIYTHFPVKPNCNLPLTGLYDDMNILSKSEGEFTIYSGHNPRSSIDTSIVMGNIEYPIDLENVMPNYADIVPSYLRRNIVKALIFMPIGSVNIAASRESLQLTDTTKKEIEKVFSKVAEEILAKFQAEIDTATNLYEMIKIYNKAMSGQNVHQEMMRHLTFQGKTLLDWELEQNSCRSEPEIDPATGLQAKDYHGRPKRKYKFKAMTFKRVHHIMRTNDQKRVETYSINAENEFSMFCGPMSPTKLENEVLFVIEDRFQKNGSKKVVGQGAILRAIGEKFREATEEYDGRMFLVDSKQEVLDLAKLHHYPEDLLRIYKMSDYESAYVPKKAVRGQVKVWEAKRGGKPFETTVNMDDYDVPQYYIKAEGQDLRSETLRDNMELNDQLRILSQVVPTENVFMFRKTVWNKIPEDWVEVDLKLIEQQVKEHPEWWIQFNRNVGSRQALNSRVNLTNLNVKLNIWVDGKKVTDGYVDTLRDGVTPDPRGMNFEDNMEVLQGMFGRPQIYFADAFYPDGRYGGGVLDEVSKLLPVDCKLYKAIRAGRERAQQNFEKEKVKAKAKIPLLKWIDWDKVSLREVAEYLGYTVTPYIAKP